MKTDSCRRDSDPQSGQGVGSSIWLNDRSFSNLFKHVPHVYSYSGMVGRTPRVSMVSILGTGDNAVKPNDAPVSVQS